jgi:hypothetical protein
MPVKRDWVAVLTVLCLVAFGLTVPPAAAQQISPNPNPLGNTITVTGSEFNDLGVLFENFGEILIDWPALFTNSGTLDNTGVINSYGHFDNLGTLSNDGDANIFGSMGNFGTVANSSSLYLTYWFDNYGTVTNDAYMENAGATLNNHVSVANNDYVLNTGTINNYDTWSNNGTFDNDNELYNYAGWTNNGSLTNYLIFENYSNLTNPGTLTNYGTLVNNGLIDSSSGTLINSGPFATLSGSGEIIGDLIDSGSVSPGNSPSVLIITGNWLKTGGLLEIELGGTFDGGGIDSLTEFDWLNVTGNVDLAGVLNVQLINSFLLGDGMSFVIVQVGGILNGQFDGLGEGANVGNFGGTDLFITYAGGDGNDVALFSSLSTIPEPSSLALVAGLLGFYGIRRLRQHRRSQGGS